MLANPPFNVSDWGGDRLRDDARWRHGTPPKGNANFAWIQHMIHYLSPTGTAGVVMANGSMSSNTSGEGDIRRNLIEADLVDCMVAFPVAAKPQSGDAFHFQRRGDRRLLRPSRCSPFQLQ
ncbi:MAG: N-6 DNA methylase [Sphingomonadales bacterium]